MTAASSLWLLCDERMSHRSQLRGVAEQLNYGAEEKELRYNTFAALANGFFGARLWHLTRESREKLKAPWPDIVIAAGRRSAPVALAIKKRSPGTKIVHLMWPDVSPSRFDLIAVPENDMLSYKGPNLICTFGAPHRVGPSRLSAEATRWQSQVARLPRPFIAVLIGGDTRHATYEQADFKTLAAYAAAEAERLGGSLLVTSSPRTGEEGEKLVKGLLTVPHLFHPFRKGEENPYTAFLGLADAVIVTGDSVSMCSEACATGRPLYIFMPPHIKKDPASFREILFARGAAKPHTYPIRLDWQPVAVPSAAEEVANAIRTRMLGV